MNVEISLGAIKRNFKRIENAAGKPLILMCKANAYGHGAPEVSQAVAAEYYGVATEEEGVPFREASKQVLVTAPSFYALPLCARYDMMGAGEPGVPYGVRDFKSEFGGELVEHGRFLCVTQPILYKLGVFAVRLLKRIK